MLSSTPARIVCLPDKKGSLNTGMDADIVFADDTLKITDFVGDVLK